jgi:hypothetical protein
MSKPEFKAHSTSLEGARSRHAALGGAFGDVRTTTNPPAFLGASGDQAGWAAGAGFEWLFVPNWSFKAEYLHYDLGTFVCGVGACAPGQPVALANEFSKSQRWLINLPASMPDEQRVSIECSMRRWISKRIVRSGFEVTMTRSDHFTRDLYLCYEQFAPERADETYHVLGNCLTGDHSHAQYMELVKLLTGESLRLLL